MLAISTGRAILIGLAAGVAVVLLAATLFGALRRRRTGPDIPPGMQPGPSDADLEKPILEKMVAWGALSVVFMAIWVPVVWLREPSTNFTDQKARLEDSVQRGENSVQLFTEENPAGVGCVGCHGEGLAGGQTIFQGETWPVPSLQNVCERLTLDQVIETIAQGRPKTPMPSWSVRYAGSLNDQQINDIVNYILSIQKVQDDKNLCKNPPQEEAS